MEAGRDALTSHKTLNPKPYHICSSLSLEIGMFAFRAYTTQEEIAESQAPSPSTLNEGKPLQYSTQEGGIKRKNHARVSSKPKNSATSC